ncbi:MAG: small multi-drug export protein, partial [Candidatus Altiarchaeota archaeon]|nr:small multi-drug export protein [Candidatus Altiarchaeota archaeon]
GLMLFVAVPLPGTGAYAGALVAHMMGMKNKKAFLSIALGVVIAGVVVLLVATMFKETLGWILELKLF